MNFNELCDFVLVNEMANKKGGKNYRIVNGEKKPVMFYANGYIEDGPEKSKQNMNEIINSVDDKFYKDLNSQIKRQSVQISPEQFQDIVRGVEDYLSEDGINYDELLYHLGISVSETISLVNRYGNGDTPQKRKTIAAAIISSLKDTFAIQGRELTPSQEKSIEQAKSAVEDAEDKNAAKAARDAKVEDEVSQHTEEEIADMTPEELAEFGYSGADDEFNKSIVDDKGPSDEELDGEVDIMSDEELIEFEKELARKTKAKDPFDDDEDFTMSDVEKYGGRSRGYNPSPDDEDNWY